MRTIIDRLFLPLLMCLVSVGYVRADETVDSLVQHGQLEGITVYGSGAQQNLRSAQMGKMTFDETTIIRTPVLLGEPDIIKTLQTMPGVSPGIEGFAGMYVRGGENDQNQFLFQGLPIYQVSHLGGIFSTFNVATIDQVNFYKSAFPAQFGGRVSSITEVSMKRPDFEHFHGRLSLGLLSGNAFVSGPIVKDKLAFTAAVRRSWMDVVTLPALAIVNAINKKDGEKTKFGYNFMDFNAQIVWKAAPNSDVMLMGYYGHDGLKIGNEEFNATPTADDEKYHRDKSNNLSWGNWGILARSNTRLGRGLLRGDVYYGSYGSKYKQTYESYTNPNDPMTRSYSKSTTRNSINDVGINLSYTQPFGNVYILKGGAGYIHHTYHPSDITDKWMTEGKPFDQKNDSPLVKADEAIFFLDNNLDFGDWLSFNAGLRYSIYGIAGKTYGNLEPRASVRVNVAPDYSIKLGYARMSQYVQQVSSNAIDLPTDLWLPVEGTFEPLRTDQYAVGLYGNLPWWDLFFSVEGWYKKMKGLYEYREGISILDTDLTWQQKLTQGNGDAYGMDLSITRDVGKLTGTVSYGLMWNNREFADLNQGVKFPAKFDNRHKINISASYRLTEDIVFNANWVYMTGNRMTLTMYDYEELRPTLFPDAPGGSGSVYNDYVSGDEGIGYISSRNNIRLPAYHRLDLGVTWYRHFKNGHRGWWNFSLYNAYCHMNAITIVRDYEIKKKADLPDPSDSWGEYEGRQVFKTLSLLPVVPSVSFTYEF